MSTNTAAAAVEITRIAQEAAASAGENWADAVDVALEKAGFETLSPVTYGAEHDTRLVAVVRIDGAAIGIWHYDDGTWTSGPALLPCDGIILYGAGGAHDVGRVITGDDRDALLATYRDTGAMLGAYLVDPSLYDSHVDLSAMGPDATEINWDGLCC